MSNRSDFYFTFFISSDISMLINFLIVCLSDFIDNCKSPVDTISKTISSVFNN